MLNRKLQNFYDLANLERSEIRDLNSNTAELNPMQRMIKNNEREREIDIEERFQYRNLPVYPNTPNHPHNKHQSQNELDTILYHYHTSSDNIHLPPSRVSFDSKAKAEFAIPHNSINEKHLQSLSNMEDNCQPSSLIMVDVFQRFRDQPKVTRELPVKVKGDKPTLKKVKKVDPSKNRRKIDETIQTTFEDKVKRSKTKNDKERVLDMGKAYTQNLINKGVIYSKTNTGAFVLVPNLPSLQRPNQMRDNFMDSIS